MWNDHTDPWPTKKLEKPAVRVPKFYVEGLEDHLTPAIFQTWGALAGIGWATALLRLLGSSVDGSVQHIAWSYQFVERLPAGGYTRMADIIVQWQDRSGRAITVVEAKKPKGKIGKKDLGGDDYTTIPSLVSAGRRVDYALLVDAGDRDRLVCQHPHLPKIVTWQDMVALQIQELKKQDARSDITAMLIGALIERSNHLGIQPACGTATEFDVVGAARGTRERYRELSRMLAPSPLEELLIGFDVVLTAQQGRMPQAPYEWLHDEPDALAIADQKNQGEKFWTAPIWRLDWRGYTDDPVFPTSR